MSDISQSDGSRRVRRTAPIWAVVAIGIAALLVGLLGGALLLEALQAGTSAKLAELESQNATLTARVDALTASLTVAASQATATPTPPATSVAVVPKPAATVKVYAYIKSASVSGGTLTVVADYVQYLTGSAATHAAAVHGGSVGYGGSYVLNESSTLRHLHLLSSAKVLLIEWFETGTAGSSIKTGQVTSKDFVDAVRGVLTSPSGVWSPAHHVFAMTVTGDDVSRIEQLPGY